MLKKIDPTVLFETAYIAVFCLGTSILMELIYVVIGMWNYTVLLGNLLGVIVAILNFFLMGITVQKAVHVGDGEEENKQIQTLMRFSLFVRMVLMFAVALMAGLLPCFDLFATIIPLFYPRIAIAFRPLLLPMQDEVPAKPSPSDPESTQKGSNGNE